MSKQADAITKVRAEMANNTTNTYVQAIGNLLLLHLENNPESAESVLTDGKTIVKSFDAMRKAAEKKKVGNCAVLTDAEGFAIVLDYFKRAEPAATVKPDKSEKRATGTPTTKASDPKTAPTPEREQESEPDDDIDFDALLM